MRIERVGPRAGYDLWAGSYDATPNPVVAIDRQVTPGILDPQPGEHILDAGCGTGGHIAMLLDSGADVIGMDFSPGMLAVARRRFPGVALVEADLSAPWPFAGDSFDAVLCALVGEHLDDLDPVFSEAGRVLRPGGRFVFSVYHPWLAEAGKEANFVLGDTEYRLGAVRHTLDDYEGALLRACFSSINLTIADADEQLARDVPAAEKLLGRPIVVVYRAASGGGLR